MKPSAKEVRDTVLRFNPVAFDRNADDDLGKSLGDKGTRLNMWRVYHRKHYKGKNVAILAAGNMEID